MGTLVLAGATSGSATLTPVDAVTAVITLPSATATLATLGANTFVGNQAITGTLSTTSTAVIGSSTNGQLQLNNAGGNNGASLWFSGSSVASGLKNWIINQGDFASGQLTFAQANSAGGVIGSSSTALAAFKPTGQFIVGNDTPILTSFQTINFSGSTYNGLAVNDSASANGVGFIFFTIGGSAIGNVSRVSATSAVAYNTTSDYRIKDLFGSFTSARDMLSSLIVHDGQFKGGTNRQPLLIAHEVQEVTPWAVTGKKDAVNEDGSPDYQQLATGTHEALLIAGWQNHEARLAALEAK